MTIGDMQVLALGGHFPFLIASKLGTNVSVESCNDHRDWVVRVILQTTGCNLANKAETCFITRFFIEVLSLHVNNFRWRVNPP